MPLERWAPSLYFCALSACIACAPGKGQPAAVAAPASTTIARPLAPVAAPLVADLPPRPATVATAAFTPFGRVVAMEERQPLWSLPATQRPAPAPGAPARYERWHEKAKTTVGYGYLSILDLSTAERALLVVSEDEAKLRVYDFPSLHLVSSVAVDGYKQYGRGDFVFAPTSASRPFAVFAGENGLFLLDTASPGAVALSEQPADSLRWTDDHAVLGASCAFIPEQRSRLVFYAFTRAGGLEPLVSLDFAERVEEWDLDAAKKRLAVTYYPSNQTELLDLASRQVLWAAAAPEYANSVDISPDDSKVAVGGSSVVVHDARTGSVIAADAHFGNNIHRVRFSPSGDALAVSSYEGKLRIFDAKAPGPALPLRRLLRHSGTANVYALSFTHDGKALVSGSGDKTVRVWGE